MFSSVVIPLCEGLLIDRFLSSSTENGEQALPKLAIYLPKHLHIALFAILFPNTPFPVRGLWKWQCFPLSNLTSPSPEPRFRVAFFEGKIIPPTSTSEWVRV